MTTVQAAPTALAEVVQGRHGDLAGNSWSAARKAAEQVAASLRGDSPALGRPSFLRYIVPQKSTLPRRLRESSDLSVLLFSGYDWEEIRGHAARSAIVPYVDVLLAGRYHAEQRLARGLQGSSNKTLHFLSTRYGPADLAAVPDAEVLIGADGIIRLSGIAPMKWPTALTTRPR